MLQLLTSVCYGPPKAERYVKVREGDEPETISERESCGAYLLSSTYHQDFRYYKVYSTLRCFICLLQNYI